MMNRILNIITTKNMRDDLEFYIKHNDEMYFDGMAAIAVAWIGLVVFGFYIMLVAEDITFGILFALFGAYGFGTVKMYLHVRKDAIEIKEMLKK